MLTEKQKKTLELLADRDSNRKSKPSRGVEVSQLRSAMGVRGNHIVYGRVRLLEERGLVDRVVDDEQSISYWRVTTKGWETLGRRPGRKGADIRVREASKGRKTVKQQKRTVEAKKSPPSQPKISKKKKVEVIIPSRTRGPWPAKDEWKPEKRPW